MDGISPGTTLGGRYVIDRALSSRDGVEQWIARDTTLGREVTVTIFAQDHPHQAAALDAARRVAGVEERRLAQVLDVGTDSDPDIAYVVTEATHPSDSLAALIRLDTLPGEEVRRVVGEAALALETARARGLHHGTLTPLQVLRASDGSVQVTDVATGGALAGLDEDDDTDGSREDVLGLVRIVYAGLTGQWPGGAEPTGLPVAERRADGMLPAPSELVDAVPADLDTLCRTVLNDDEGPQTPGDLARQLSPWSAEQVYGVGGRTADERPYRDGSRGSSAGAAAAASAPGRTGGDWFDDNTDPGTTARAREDDDTMVASRSSFADSARRGRSDDGDDGRYDDETGQYRLDDDPYVEEDLEPPLPLLSHGRDEPDERSSRLALAIVALVVVLAMVLGFLGLRTLLPGDDDTTEATPSGPSASSSTRPGASSSTASSAAPTSDANALEITRISSFDPFGDGNENRSQVTNLIDGDPATTWETEQYRSNLGDGGKDGTGVMLNLGSSKSVRSVKITVDGPGVAGRVLVTDRTRLRGAQELGTFDGSGVQTVTGSEALEGRYVIVFLTRLTDAGGTFQGKLGEVQVLP